MDDMALVISVIDLTDGSPVAAETSVIDLVQIDLIRRRDISVIHRSCARGQNGPSLGPGVMMRTDLARPFVQRVYLLVTRTEIWSVLYATIRTLLDDLLSDTNLAVQFVRSLSLDKYLYILDMIRSRSNGVINLILKRRL